MSLFVKRRMAVLLSGFSLFTSIVAWSSPVRLVRYPHSRIENKDVRVMAPSTCDRSCKFWADYPSFECVFMLRWEDETALALQRTQLFFFVAVWFCRVHRARCLTDSDTTFCVLERYVSRVHYSDRKPQPRSMRNCLSIL